ncbi:hypothetical protein TR13x_08830 [Caloranaerobacter sp. TR13]|uniref:hypothetical protein n=1 Tax=Caloranaerobacter sp. TR13 TaxID=1302151 RepID=UPI0006D3DD47|nr:hypothetical protein [Caloranaerobacter sp. TR13]KPU26674.1 hypothetical protein TR13x_08830 [Caloranaerobacter sp. TR13]
MIKCNFCGYEFNENESQKGCHGCPLNKSCNKYKCPNCGFEIPKEPKLIQLIRKWRKRNG